MPTHDLGYRGWAGQAGSPWLRWLIIAETGVRLAFKNAWLRRMLFVVWMPTAAWGVGFFVYEQALKTPELRRGLEAGPLRVLENRELDRGGSSNPNVGFAAVRRAFQEDPEQARHQVWSLLLMTFFQMPQNVLMVLLIGLIAPPLISQDLRSKAYLLYFARPITPLEYVLGKAAVLWSYLALVLTLPALALYVLGVLLSPDLEVVYKTWDLPFRIVAASLVVMTPTTVLALLFSAMTAESRYAGFAWFAIWILGRVAYVYLRSFDVGTHWSAVSMFDMLVQIQSWVFGLQPSFSAISFSLAFVSIVTVGSAIVLMNLVTAPLRI